MMPHAPFRFERVPGRSRTARVRRHGPSGTLEATVTVLENGEVEWELGPGTERLDQALDLLRGAAFGHWTTGASYDHWRVETSVFTISWPEGFAVESVPSSPPPFDLVGPDDARIWIQGPIPEARLDPLDRMEGPGQRTERIMECAGGPLVELVYEHEGAPWRMFHCIVDRNPPRRRGVLSFLRREPPRYACVVSAQTPERGADRAREAVEEVAASLTPCPPEP